VRSASDGGAYLARVGFVIYFVTLVGSSLLLCDCGAIPGVIMAACSLLPLIFGSRLQRLATVVCLAIACVFAVVGYRSAVTSAERAERARQIQQQPLNAQ
jgi:hypothetical protein